MKERGCDHANNEVSEMNKLTTTAMAVSAALLPALLNAGCSLSARHNLSDPAIHSDQGYYYQINVIPPDGRLPPYTPYGTPANFGTSSEYGRTVRPDSISRYTP